MRHFHNTTNEPEHIRQRLECKARTQDERVLAYFKAHPGRHYRPDQVHSIIDPLAPLTSIRRAITNLTKAGKLVKSDLKDVGVFGRNTNTWYYPAGYVQMDMFN